ncbi:hypothetical protein LCGC14_2673780 [marine sediment metagenome]|uniref:Uncharacterized protein n=1 Tax=marine sediment metagenome TaxID=412755 RepID=A0A0F9AAU4_9ZZZZ
MTKPSKLADRLIERVFGSKRNFTPQELEDQTPPSPPRSVHAQLKEQRKGRQESRQRMRNLRLY